MAAALEEQRAVIAAYGPDLSMEALGAMDVLQRCITEALRLFPPLIMLLRQAKAPFAVTTRAGRRYVVPKVQTYCDVIQPFIASGCLLPVSGTLSLWFPP